MRSLGLGEILRDFVSSHCVIRSLESLECELLDICMTGNFVNDRIIISVIGFRLSIMSCHSLSFWRWHHLLQLVHELHGVGLAFVISLVESFGNYLLDDPIVAYYHFSTIWG